MKKTIYSILGAAMLLMLASCGTEVEPARTPVASIDINKTTLVINESMEIHFTGVADQVVIFTGDEGRKYQDYGKGEIKANTGVVVNKGFFTYSYAVPGVFHVVVVASTYDTYSGNGLKQAKYEFDVTVDDDINTIDKIFFQSQAHNVFYANAVNDKDWVFCIPTCEVYNNKDVKTNISRRSLSFEIASDSAKVYIDGEVYASRNTYNLDQNHDLKVVSYKGSTREYKLWTLRYPEFTTIAVGEAEGTLKRDAFNQDLLTYTFTGVSGKDGLVETHEDGVEFLVNGKAPTSDVDYSDPDNVYTLVRTDKENTAVKAVTRVKFVFN